MGKGTAKLLKKNQMWTEWVKGFFYDISNH
jgi:hypothetical protein